MENLLLTTNSARKTITEEQGDFRYAKDQHTLSELFSPWPLAWVVDQKQGTPTFNKSKMRYWPENIMHSNSKNKKWKNCRVNWWQLPHKVPSQRLCKRLRNLQNGCTLSKHTSHESMDIPYLWRSAIKNPERLRKFSIRCEDNGHSLWANSSWSCPKSLKPRRKPRIIDKRRSLPVGKIEPPRKSRLPDRALQKAGFSL